MREQEVLLVEDDGGVRTLLMNRPDKLNALNTPLTAALVQALAAADADERPHAVVLAGAGRGFCAGADTAEFKDLRPENAHLVEERADLTAKLHSMIRGMTKPVVSAVRGIAVGGGAGLAVACDMLVAGDDVKFGYPELKHGLLPAIVMTNLTRQLGPKLAFELISTGRLLTAAEMFAAGLANRVVAAAEVLTTAREIAKVWAAASPQAMRTAKALFHEVAELSFEAGMAAGRDANVRMRAFPIR